MGNFKLWTIRKRKEMGENRGTGRSKSHQKYDLKVELCPEQCGQ